MIFPFRDDVPAQRFPIVTCALIAVNALAFLWLESLPPVQRQVAVYEHGFVPARIGQLRSGQPLEVKVRLMRVVQPWNVPVEIDEPHRLAPVPGQILSSLVTMMFMHGGWLHLLGNMWFLWLFGDNVEDRLGHGTFLAFYLVGGLLASACHWTNDPHSMVPAIGASGAVAAVLGAYAVTWPHARIHCLVVLVVFVTVFDLPALFVLGLWFVGQVIEATRAIDLPIDGGVAWWAHIGGFLAGMLLMPLIGARSRRRTRADNDEDA